MDKNIYYLLIILLLIYSAYKYYSKENIKENLENTKKKLDFKYIDDHKKIADQVEITKLAIIKEPILLKYLSNTNHITNSNQTLINKITHPIRYKLKFNKVKYNLYEMRIIKSERLVSFGEKFDLEIHLIHRDERDNNNILTIVFPIKTQKKNEPSNLLQHLLGSIYDIPEDNKFNVYNGKINTIDYNCFKKYMQDTEICFYAPTENKIHLIIQKPIFCNKYYIKRIKQVLA